MIFEIEDSLINDDLKALITSTDGKNSLDVSKLKTQADVDRILGSKRHVDNELSELKNKYKDIDIDNYNALLASQLEQNKDVLNNPVYKNLETKFNSLTAQLNQVNAELAKRDQAILDNELKDLIRQNKDIAISAVDDVFYRLKMAGFEKTEKGFLNKDGVSPETFIESLKSTSKHLFKQTSSIKFNQQNINSSLKNNDKKALFQSLNIVNQ